jgi:hypothetical protein
MVAMKSSDFFHRISRLNDRFLGNWIEKSEGQKNLIH